MTPSQAAGPEAAPQTSAVVMRGVHKRYGGVHAVNDAWFEVRPGEVHALLGENGAGKSTLVKILSGIVNPDEGEIEVDGKSVRFAAARDAQALGIQTIHQELELALPLSVEENVFLGNLPARRGLLDRGAMRRQTAEVLRLLGVDIAPTARVDSLRVSDRQVVEIARAMVRKLRILIMDEPTAALPPVEVERVFARVRSLRNAGVGIIYISHKLDEVLQIADRITVMRDGRVVANLDRKDVDRETLVRHILGRDLANASITRSPKSGNHLVRCRNLRSESNLQDATFDVSRGEVVGFFGLLGSGYGAVGEALFGIRSAEADEVQVVALRRLPANPAEAIASHIGYVPADRKREGLLLRASIHENLILPSYGAVTRFGLIDRARARSVAERLVSIFGIRCASVTQNAGELSGGNQQKIVIAKWQPTDARLLIMDEPTRGVDVGAKAEIYRQLRGYVSDGAACIILSSDAEEIAKTCDRAYVLKRGRIEAELVGADLTVAALTQSAL